MRKTKCFFNGVEYVTDDVVFEPHDVPKTMVSIRRIKHFDQFEMIGYIREKVWIEDMVLRHPNGGWYKCRDGFPKWPIRLYGAELERLHEAMHAINYDPEEE